MVEEAPILAECMNIVYQIMRGKKLLNSTGIYPRSRLCCRLFAVYKLVLMLQSIEPTSFQVLEVGQNMVNTSEKLSRLVN